MSILRLALLAAVFAFSIPGHAGPAVSTGTGDDRFTANCINEVNGASAIERDPGELDDYDYEGGVPASAGPGAPFEADCQERR